MAHRFNPAKLDRLNDVGRLDDLVPDLMWDAFGTPAARVVIEVGAGTGMFAREFAARMAAGGVLHAVDSEPTMIHWMSDNLPDDLDSRIDIVSADATGIPLEDRSADLVYSVNLHHELDAPGDMLGEAFRLLRPGGVVAIVDWKREPTPKGPPLEHRIGTGELVLQLRSAGFSDVTSHDVLPYHDVVTGRRA